MNVANYSNTKNKYPLSIESMAFIQEQIMSLQSLSHLFGEEYYILKNPTTTQSGIVIIKGEVLPLQAGAPSDYIEIKTEKISITANNESFSDIRDIRTAYYASSYSGGSESYLSSNFINIPNSGYGISSIKSKLETTQNHLLPKGSIIMWSGTTDENSVNFPHGFKLCNGQTVEGYGKVPDLRGRFIVGYGQYESNDGRETEKPNYKINDTGGINKYALTTGEMPKHKHKYADAFYSESKYGNDGLIGSNDTDFDNQMIIREAITEQSGGNEAHENRPPYYALAYLIKVI